MVSQLSNRLIEDADMSSRFVSEHITLAQRIGFSIHAVFTGSPVGSMYISVSINGIDWMLLPDSTEAITAAGDVFYNVCDVKYLMARLHYTATSGTGSLDAFVNTKEAQ